MSASPTFMKVIEGAHDSSRAILAELQVDLRRVLHAEQQFEYHLPIRAGDHLTITRTVTDIYEKKDGAMEFIVIESVAAQPNGAIAARSRQVILVRSPAPEANA
jgi:hydroxyacyl-ACP dehydratase HTD2-like protein with hotdog domain